MEILVRISKNSKANGEKVFTRLYRYLLRSDLYFTAYKNLYANNGASTKGVINDIADGFSEDKISKIIKSLREEIFQPMPVIRVYVEKKNDQTKNILLVYRIKKSKKKFCGFKMVYRRQH